MRLECIRIKGFRSFTEQVTFSFEREPGLYYITGVNKVEPDLETNGVGKSSIWYALAWCLYGRIPGSGLRNPNLVNWESEQPCEVSVDFRIEGTYYSIVRTAKPNSLLLLSGSVDKEYVTQDQLDARLLTLPFEAFSHSVLMGQSAPMFFDLGPTEKANLFSRVLDLDQWLACSKRASVYANRYACDVAEIEKDISNLQGKLDEARSKNYTEEIERWKQDNKRHIASVKRVLSKRRLELAETRSHKESLQEQVEKAEEDKKDVDMLLREYQDSLQNLQRKEQALSNEASVCSHKISETVKSRDWFKETKQCAQCRQVIEHSHKKEELNRLNAIIRELSNGMQSLKEDVTKLRHEIQDKRTQIEDLQLEREKANKKLTRLSSELSAVSNSLKHCVQEIEDKETELERITREKNPYVKMQRELNERKRKYVREKKKRKGELREAQRQEEDAKYWVRGFQDLRLYLISEALTQLELEVNNNLTAIGLPEWEIHFDVDRETKAGTVSRGFTVTVLSPRNSEAVPWDVWSGGESQRLKLAGTMGLANLIQQGYGVDCNVEIWDEPSSWCSPRGIVSLLDMLHDRAHKYGKQIWVADHHAVEYGKFTDTVTLVKTNAGTQI